MTKMCAACEQIFKSAGYIVLALADIPEGNGKCDFCKKKRWVKATLVKHK